MGFLSSICIVLTKLPHQGQELELLAGNLDLNGLLVKEMVQYKENLN